MLARSEVEPIYTHYDHAVFETVSISSNVLSSVEISKRVNGRDIIRHPYPTKIIQTDMGDFFLEHFSAFESGYEESPN